MVTAVFRQKRCSPPRLALAASVHNRLPELAVAPLARSAKLLVEALTDPPVLANFPFQGLLDFLPHSLRMDACVDNTGDVLPMVKPGQRLGQMQEHLGAPSRGFAGSETGPGSALTTLS